MIDASHYSAAQPSPPPSVLPYGRDICHLPACTRGCATRCNQPTPSASQFRAHAVRLARELLLSLAEQWNQFVTRPAPPALRVPPPLPLLSLSLSLDVSLPLSYLTSRQETRVPRIDDISSLSFIVRREMHRDDPVPCSLIREIWFKRMRVHKIKVSFCSLHVRLPPFLEIRLPKQARYDVVDRRLSSFWDCLSCQFSMLE